MGPDLDRAPIAAHQLDLFLEAELLSLEFAESQTIGRGTTKFVLDRAFKGLVTNAKFTNTGFDGHDRASMSDWLLK